MTFTEIIMKTLTTRIAPMVYIMMFVNVLIGFMFATQTFVSASDSILYATGVLIPREIWGAMLLTTAVAAEIGFVTSNPTLVSFGGLGGFMLWLFATIEVAMAGEIYVLLTIAVFHLLFHGYVYLAASLGVLERKAINGG